MNPSRRSFFIMLALLLGAGLSPGAAAAAVGEDSDAPTLADVPYGPHQRNDLDFWRAAPAQVTPLVIYFHGGGFVAGDKAEARQLPLRRACLAAGLAFASINYRYLSPSAPLPVVLRDCARAVQFIRAHAKEWRIDPRRIAACGISAGGGISLWLAFHYDLADVRSADPVLRESSRLCCAGADSAQFSYDPLRWEEVFGREATQRYGREYQSPRLFGFATDAELRGPAAAAVRADCDTAGLITPDDPPVFLDAGPRSTALTSVNQLLHHPRHSLLLYERCRKVGVPVVAIIPAYGIAPGPGEPATLRDFLLRELKRP